jgi:putative colanic acid biosynthesis glycosyltransferase
VSRPSIESSIPAGRLDQTSGRVTAPQRFSVITVVLNDKPGFQRTRASLEAQSFKDFEWIVVDGASTDGTLDEIRSIAAPSHLWISERDSGLFDAMNKGLFRARGEYIVFMNAGDTFAGPEVLRQVDSLLKVTPGVWDLAFGHAYEQAEDGTLLLKRARAASAIRYGMFTHHQAMFYRRAAIGKVRYDTSFHVAADYHFTCCFLKAAQRTLRIDLPVCVFTRGGLSMKKAETGRREALAIQKQTLKLSPGRRMLNHAAFLGSSLMRTHMRGLYDRLRFVK